MIASKTGGLRQEVARLAPAGLRKAVRMGEHYLRRQRDWARLLRAARGVSPRDRLTLAASAAAAPVTALRSLDGYGSPVLLRDVRVRVDGVGMLGLRRGTDDPIHVLRAREPHVWTVLDEKLRPGDTFVDAGANIGFYSLRASQLVGREGRVVAVEMMPETAATLRSNVATSDADNVVVIERALASRDGDSVTATSDPARLGQASIAAAAPEGRTLKARVETARLDTIVPPGPVALMKMDLEGAEHDALVGGQGLLERTKAIVFENNGEDPRIAGLLSARGFQLRHLAGHDYLAERDLDGKDR